MSTVTIDAVIAKQAELTKMIEALQSATSFTYGIPEAMIDLKAGERYAGIVLSEDGEPAHHLVLLPGEAEDVTWEQAKEWAAKQGGDLPTRQEQALLFANLKSQFKPNWHWSNQAHETNSSWAWYQTFSNGNQTLSSQDYELRARAVRRLVIE
ncbi:MAG: DUF1566 domain-containing protein [Aquabacterium sp.]|jgi:hypothetical protein|uniref:DUF1566 domain-containing protein n=1 Tax=Aquabacterium sp. TaxID=1872578 RepID=UPI002A359CA2|nr:DUF1566 domain-containing protein [Aquabacterium sp.]MDX9843629.1 DUF1566 domain-containing protein [Aquabacterium sp.]